jgi:hypothetical protein
MGKQKNQIKQFKPKHYRKGREKKPKSLQTTLHYIGFSEFSEFYSFLKLMDKRDGILVRKFETFADIEQKVVVFSERPDDPTWNAKTPTCAILFFNPKSFSDFMVMIDDGDVITGFQCDFVNSIGTTFSFQSNRGLTLRVLEKAYQKNKAMKKGSPKVSLNPNDWMDMIETLLENGESGFLSLWQKSTQASMVKLGDRVSVPKPELRTRSFAKKSDWQYPVPPSGRIAYSL